MASISAHTFEYIRSIGTDGVCQIMHMKSHKHLEVNVQRRTGTRWNGAQHVRLPLKMVDAMIHACWLFDRDNQHMRQKWRPRWPA